MENKGSDNLSAHCPYLITLLVLSFKAICYLGHYFISYSPFICLTTKLFGFSPQIKNKYFLFKFYVCMWCLYHSYHNKQKRTGS